MRLYKLYAWSVAFELLLFFAFSLHGVTISLGRSLQIIVLIGLTSRFFLQARLDRFKIINFISPLYKYYIFYFVLLIFACINGIFSGAYYAPSFFLKSTSNFLNLLSSPISRTILEYVMTLYYFFYYIVLPAYMFKSKESLNYCLSVFKATFIISFVLGIVNFGFSALGHPFLALHLIGGRTVEDRFHGLAGEPRDAFVYLVFGFAILHLQAYFKGVNLNKWWILVIALAALATRSTSGLIGIIFFIIIYSVYSLRRIRFLKISKLTFFVFLAVIFVYIGIVSSERSLKYIESAKNLWDVLERGDEIPYPISVQSVNIYPIYDLVVKMRRHNFFAILLGSGLGTASILNNQFFDIYLLRNTNSQFVRLIYEGGIIGCLLFIAAFICPVECLTKNISSKKRGEFVLISLLLIGCLLGHRHAAPFIYLGIFIAAFRLLDKTKGVV